jgi:hypothetical protein
MDVAAPARGREELLLLAIPALVLVPWAEGGPPQTDPLSFRVRAADRFVGDKHLAPEAATRCAPHGGIWSRAHGGQADAVCRSRKAQVLCRVADFSVATLMTLAQSYERERRLRAADI